jgi:ATP-dependent DNA ligase
VCTTTATTFGEPKVVVEVAFTDGTDDGLQHPSFQDPRKDKDPREVVAERPE